MLLPPSRCVSHLRLCTVTKEVEKTRNVNVYLLPRHERGERWDSRAAPPSTLVLHRSWFISPPLNLTEDLTDKMLVHVNKNYIVGFVFEHSFEWYNFRWHASAFIVLYIMLVQFLVVLIYSSKVPVRCTEEWNALIGELFILTKDVGVISCVMGIDRFVRILSHL